MKTIYVGVSGINAVDNPGPGIGVARSLREDPELNVKIVGLAYDAMDPGIYMDWVVDKTFMMPYPSGSGEAFLERLAHIKESYGLEFVIPNLDSELPFYIKYAARLREEGIGAFLPTADQFRLRAKDKLRDVARDIGVQIPRTIVVSSPSMLSEGLGEIEFPVMVKGCFYKAYRCNTPQEASARFQELAAEWGYPVILQEVVSGDELNVIGLGDGEGNCLGLIGVKKTWVTSQGKMWSGVTVKNEPMLAAAEKFTRGCRWRGPFELECIVDGDEVYLIEINPRFPAWVYLSTGVGMNLPSRLLRCSLGLPYETSTDYPAGKLFVRYSYDLVTDMTAFQNTITRGENP